MAREKRLVKSSPLEIEAVRTTQHACGWLLAIAEVSKHPDAEAAARWLDDIGSQAFEWSELAAMVAHGAISRGRRYDA